MEAGTITHGSAAIRGRSPWARLPDRLLKWVLTGIAALILILIAYFFLRLINESTPVFDKVGVLHFVFGSEWVPSQGQYGALPLLVGTIITSAIALGIGVPVAVAS